MMRIKLGSRHSPIRVGDLRLENKVCCINAVWHSPYHLLKSVHCKWGPIRTDFVSGMAKVHKERPFHRLLLQQTVGWWIRALSSP
jgi:hypothetical protein